MRFLLNLDCHKKMKRYLITICLAVGMVLPAAAQFTPIRIGENAKKVILNKYDTNYAFHDGLLAVKNDETGLWGFIDEQGNKGIIKVSVILNLEVELAWYASPVVTCGAALRLGTSLISKGGL